MTIEKTAEELGITEYELWCNSLAEYACHWITRCQNQIISHAKEIYEDKTLRDMIVTYAKSKKNFEKSIRYEFVKACLGDDITEVSCDETIDKGRAEAYKKVLDELIFERYCCA